MSINILKIEDLGILQAEVLHKADWVQVADQIDTSNWAIEVGADQTAIVLLDPEQAAPTPLAEIPGAGMGKKRYPFSKSLKVLGITQDEAIADIDVVMGATRLAGHIVVTPLVMSQSVDEPTYGSDAFPGQPYCLLGHNGRLGPTPEDNDLANRDIDLQRFKWESAAEVDDAGRTRIAVFCKGEAADASKLAVKTYGWRPGLTAIKATLNGYPDVEVGHWEVVCHYPSLHIPHLGQIADAYDGTASAEQPVDDPDMLPTVYIDNTMVSKDIRLLTANHMRAQYAMDQIAHEDGDPWANSDIFDWTDIPTHGFTYAQANGLLSKGVYMSPMAPRLRLFSRLRAFESSPDFSAKAESNVDMTVPLRIAARNYRDGALLSILKMGTSVYWDPETYASTVRDKATDPASRDYAPGHNMLRAWWDNPHWYTPNLWVTWDLENLFVDSGAAEWNLAHPYTRDILKHMIAQRHDLVRAQAWGIWGEDNKQAWADPDWGPKSAALHQDVTNTSALEATIRMGTDWRTGWVKVYDDLSWCTQRFTTHTPSLYVIFEGNSILQPRQGTAHYVAYTAEDGWYLQFDRKLEDEGWYVWGLDVPGNVKYRYEALEYSVEEAWYLTDIFTDLDQLKGWQEWQQALAGWTAADEDGVIAVFALWVGSTFFGLDNMYQAEFGTDFLTEERLSLTERLMSVGFAAMDVVDVAVPVAKGITRVMNGMGRNLAKRFGRELTEEAGERWLSREARDFAGDVVEKELGEEAFERATREVLQETTEDRIRKELVQDAAQDLFDVDIGARLAARNETAFAGMSLADNAMHVTPDVPASISRTRSLRDYAQWSRTVKRELKETGDAFWSNDALRDFVRNACFAAGTPVRMADGTLKSIEDIEPGDWVL